MLVHLKFSIFFYSLFFVLQNYPCLYRTGLQGQYSSAISFLYCFFLIICNRKNNKKLCHSQRQFCRYISMRMTVVTGSNAWSRGWPSSFCQVRRKLRLWMSWTRLLLCCAGTSMPNTLSSSAAWSSGVLQTWPADVFPPEASPLYPAVTYRYLHPCAFCLCLTSQLSHADFTFHSITWWARKKPCRCSSQRTRRQQCVEGAVTTTNSSGWSITR